jgi:hypothetical protein
MTNRKMIGVLLGTLAFGDLAAMARAETPANDKGKAAAKPDDKKGGQKSCGGPSGCGADKSDKGSASTDKGKAQNKPDDKKGGGQKSCGGPSGCGAKH